MATPIRDLLAQLDSAYYPFPEKLLREVIERWREASPLILEHLESVITSPEKHEPLGDHWLPLYSLYLLAQFKETRAYPLFISFFSLDEDIADAILSDGVTGNGGQLLASVWNGDNTPLYSLIENTEVDEFQRIAGLNALKILYLNEKIERSALVEYFKLLFSGRLERLPCMPWNELVNISVDLGLHEFTEDVKIAFTEGLADPGYADLPYLLEIMEKTKGRSVERLREMDYNDGSAFICDIVDELSYWHCFSQKYHEQTLQDDNEDFWDDDDLEDMNDEKNLWDETGKDDWPMPVQVEKKPGRNEPCSCGSGKKYKKCCGREE
jgi:hypothetical protein